jgi:hypothetical protein
VVVHADVVVIGKLLTLDSLLLINPGPHVIVDMGRLTGPESEAWRLESMKVNELIDVLNEISEKGHGNCDVCIMLHNTAHQIDSIRTPEEKDARVVVLHREHRPGYFMTGSHIWVSANSRAE